MSGKIRGDDKSNLGDSYTLPVLPKFKSSYKEKAKTDLFNKQVISEQQQHISHENKKIEKEFTQIKPNVLPNKKEKNILKEDNVVSPEIKRDTVTNVSVEITKSQQPQKVEKKSFLNFNFFKRIFKAISDNPNPLSNVFQKEIVDLKTPEKMKNPENRLKRMTDKHDVYNEIFKPKINLKNLKIYIQSEDYLRHAASAKVYFNNKELLQEEATTVAIHREPVNQMNKKEIPGIGKPYDQDKLLKFTTEVLGEGRGFQVGAFNDQNLRKNNGEKYSDKPNTICMYSETYVWPIPDAPNAKAPEYNKKIEVASIAVPPPACDSTEQPHCKLYVKNLDQYIENRKLDEDKYTEDMTCLAEAICKAAIDNKKTAFKGKGIKRLVIPLYGQEAFLKALPPPPDSDERQKATNILYKTLINALSAHAKDLKGVEILMSQYVSRNPTKPVKEQEDNLTKNITNGFVTPLKNKLKDANIKLKVGILKGNILEKAKSGDLIVNPWDPNSCIGNGNDGDKKSFDGVWGMGSGAGVVQNPWNNEHLLCDQDGKPREPERYIGIFAVETKEAAKVELDIKKEEIKGKEEDHRILIRKDNFSELKEMSIKDLTKYIKEDKTNYVRNLIVENMVEQIMEKNPSQRLQGQLFDRLNPPKPAKTGNAQLDREARDQWEKHELLDEWNRNKEGVEKRLLPQIANEVANMRLKLMIQDGRDERKSAEMVLAEYIHKLT